MLHFAKELHAKWEKWKTLDAPDYLRARQLHALETETKELNRLGSKRGVEFLISNNEIVAHFTDESAFLRFGRAIGVSDGDIREVIDRGSHFCMQVGGPFAESIVRMAQMVAAHLKHVNPRVLDVPVGLIAAHYVNAGAGPAPLGGDVIAINLGMERLASWNRVFAEALSSGQTRDLVPFSMLSFRRAIIGDMMVSDGFAPNVTTLLSAAITDDEQRVTYTQLLFVLYHEYGHIALGHTDRIRETKAPAKERRGFEFAADQFAMNSLLFSGAIGDALIETTHAVSLLLAGIECSEIDDRRVPPERLGHPPARDRLLRLFAFLDGKNGWDMDTHTPHDLISLVDRAKTEYITDDDDDGFATDEEL